jgi:PPK2 family polyphosphate:nucleotide phosphotransferase
MARAAFDPADYRVPPGSAVDLSRWPTRVAPFYDSKRSYREALAAGTKRLRRQQRLLYAHDRYALLLIFQAMDAAGKDGAIRHVMSGVNPQGCQVFSFQHPSAEELDHDFLWRTQRALPERGRIGIFNRSYYEEVLIVRVRPEILRAQKLPDSAFEGGDLWEGRYRSIVESEAHLVRNGTRIVKLFLHLSREEQRLRFLDRIDDPDKNWKFSDADVEQREAWDEYQRAYEACLGATSTADAPWYVVPADDKWNARLIVSRIVLRTLEDLDLFYPQVDHVRRERLQEIRRRLEQEADPREREGGEQ